MPDSTAPPNPVSVSIDAVTDILRETAAVEILPRFRALADHEVREKAGGELVTVADEAAEARIERRLRDLLPGSRVIGEEAAAVDPRVLDRLDDPEPVWVIDPIDGTGNFARGKPTFAVMVALVRDGKAVAGWIHDPMTDRTAVAERGGGAWLGDRRLQIVPPRDPADLRGPLHAGQFATPEMARHVAARRKRVGAVRSLRCAGHEYLRLTVSGEIHFALFTKLMPWDHAPGTLILREAGGVARTLDGAPYEARSYRHRGLLLAPDAATWAYLYEALFGP